VAYLEALAPTVALAAAPNDGFGDAFVAALSPAEGCGGTAGVAAGTVRRPASATAEGGAALSGSEAPANTAEPRPPAYQRRASPRAARPRLHAKAGAPSLSTALQALRETLRSVLTCYAGHFSSADVFGGIYCILK
jgi:hypothetical protein